MRTITETAARFAARLSAGVLLFIATLLTACGEAAAPPTLASVEFSPDALALVTGDTVQSTAVARDSRGTAMAGSIMYRTDDAGVASVSATGRVVAEGPGSTVVTATMGGESGTLRVTVTPPVPQVIAFAVDTATLTVAGTRTVRPMVTDVRGRVVRVPVAFASSDASIATVDDTGFVTTHRVGSVTVTATAGTASAHLTMTVVPQFVALAVGGGHTCGISGTGLTYCWGSIAIGQQDPQVCNVTGGACASAFPLEIYGGLRLKAITAGGSHTCAIDLAGGAWCWGNNHLGQVGSRIGERANAPVGVTGNLQLASIAAGRMHTCGLTPAGDAYCWGNDQHGQLGAGAVAPDRCESGWEHPCAMVPVKVAGGHTFAEILASESATCARTPQGLVYCWGLEVGGTEQDGCQNGEVARCARTPLLQAGGATFASLRAADQHRCAQAGDEILWCWGANPYGTFGNGSVTNRTDDPIVAAGGMTFATIVAARLTMCGLTTLGDAHCWGSNAARTVGSGSLGDVVPVPSPVAGGLLFDSIWSGTSASTVCAVARSGRGYCWGGGVVDPSGASNGVPVPVAGLK